MTVTLVTGGAGFLGRHVVRRLIDDGDAVVSYDRDHVPHHPPGVKAAQGELFDVTRLIRVLDEEGVERIVHTAAMSHPELSLSFPIATEVANVHGTLGVLEAARMTGVRRVVNLSSECVYGDVRADSPGGVTEAAPLRPKTPYGVTKVAGEMFGTVFSDSYQMDVISLRLTEIYGPGNPMPEILKEMLQAALRGEVFEMPYGGEHPYQFIHVRDAASAVIRAARHTGPHQGVYHVSGGDQIRLTDLCDLVRERFPAAKLHVGPGPMPGWDVQDRWDISAASRDLGYRPAHPLKEGIDSYAAHLQHNPY